MTKLQILGIVIGALLCSCAGYNYAEAEYEEQIAQAERDYAERARTLEAQYRDKEKQYSQSVIAAWEERDKATANARTSASRFESQLNSVRLENANLKRELSRAKSDPCYAHKEHIARGGELGERGVELLGRCIGLAKSCAIDKDAIVKSTQIR